MSTIKNQTSSEKQQVTYSDLCAKAPVQYLKSSWNHFYRSIGNFCAFLFFGSRWLFKNYPNITWATICSILVIYFTISLGKSRASIDHCSQQNVILKDSIAKINMDRVAYLSYTGKYVINAISPNNGSTKN